MCSGGCGKEKSNNHLFLECEFFLEVFGLVFYIGRWFIMFFRLMFARMPCNFRGLVCSRGIFFIDFKWFGCYVSRSFGRSETLIFFSTKNCHLIICLIRSSFILGGNWRLKIQHIFWILIFYGLIRQLI